MFIIFYPMYCLSLSLNSEHELNEKKNKKIWNFVKKDIETIFCASNLNANYCVTPTEDNGFLTDIQPNNQDNKIKISPDFNFAKNFELKTHEQCIAALLLAIFIRLQMTYKSAFFITCSHYNIITKAKKTLSETLGLSLKNTFLYTFINSPTPGRKPLKETPITSKEASQRYAKKKESQGNTQLKTWIAKDLKRQLNDYCKEKHITLEEALAEIIPIGINIGTYFLNKETKSQNKPL